MNVHAGKPWVKLRWLHGRPVLLSSPLWGIYEGSAAPLLHNLSLSGDAANKTIR